MRYFVLWPSVLCHLPRPVVVSSRDIHLFTSPLHNELLSKEIVISVTDKVSLFNNILLDIEEKTEDSLI